MVKFIHLTDTHLGRKNFKLKQREQDYFEIFKKIIKKGIELEVSFFIHSGDLFDINDPSHETIIKTMKVLKTLKQKKIPFYSIAGNHDLGSEETAMNVLAEAGLLINVGSKEYREIKEDKIILKGERIENCFIAGIDGRRMLTQIKNILTNSLIQKNDAEYKIFLFHHTISDLGEIYSDIPTSLLPKGFDYYAAGHWHLQKEINYDTGKIVYVGSTEYFDINDMQKTQTKRIALVDTKTKKIEFINLQTREIQVLKIDSKNKTITELNTEILQKIPKPISQEPVLIIQIKGLLKSGKKTQIDSYEIKRISKELGYLNMKIDASKLEYTKSIETVKKKVFEIEKEFFEKKGYTKKEIQNLSILLEEYSQKNEFEEINKKMEQLFLK